MKKYIYILLLFLSSIINAQQHYKITRLPFNSTEVSEMAPVIYQNGILFSSDKKNSVIVVTKDLNDNYPYNIYYVEKKGKKKWGSPKLFSSGLTSRLSESSAAFTADFNELYITRSHMANLNIGQVQRADTIRNGIFECVSVGKDWKVSSPFYYNDNDYNVAFPSLSPDGNTMYFSSRQPGGEGGYDLYYVEKNGIGWSEPKNLGTVINTTENEVFPFIHKSGRLYFSSRGHNSQGKLDIFYTEKRNGNWITPINLPRPFNSRQDDFGYVLAQQMDTGYFASNRRGSDDIYMFASVFPAFEQCPEQVDESFCYSFSETGSMDLETTSMKYEWDFGDGTKVRSIEAEHCFKEIGLYVVSLNVIDTLTGEVYFSEATYDLLIEPLEQPYITSKDTVNVDEEFTLDAKLSDIMNFEPKDYFWDFGDGNLEIGVETTHEYSSPGEYYIRLGITDGVDVEKSKDKIEQQKVCSYKVVVVVE